ncbi:MAG: hypothetical protein WBO73_06895, partial [Gammaproteobacteria bacterium]
MNNMPVFPVLMLFTCIALGLAWYAHADSKRHVVVITSSDSSYQQRTATRIQQNLDNDSTRTIII